MRSAVVNHAKDGSPALLFVPTRWHCRHAALELLTYAAADGHPKRFLQVGSPFYCASAATPGLHVFASDAARRFSLSQLHDIGVSVCKDKSSFCWGQICAQPGLHSAAALFLSAQSLHSIPTASERSCNHAAIRLSGPLQLLGTLSIPCQPSVEHHVTCDLLLAWANELADGCTCVHRRLPWIWSPSWRR